MKSFLHLCSSVFICGSVFSSASAAQPATTYLYPAGAQRGTTTEITVAGTLDANTKLWVSGKRVSAEATKTPGKFKVTVDKDTVPGTYWLRAYNAEGASTPRPFVVGVLPEVMEKEPNDEPRKAQAIEGPSVVVNGKLEKNGDVDCFAVSLKKGQTLVASFEAHDTLRSPMDAMLQIVTPDGFVLDENNDFHGLDPQLAFTAMKDGTYVARVYAFPAAPDSSIRYFGSDACVYRLTLTTGAFADYTMPLAFAAEGKPEVEVRGWNLTPESHKLTFAMSDGFATAFGPTLANPLRLRVENHPVVAKTADALKPPFSVTGLIEKPGGASQFNIEATKAKPFTLYAESRSLGLAVNPVVRVLDKEGKQLSRAEPGKLNGDTSLTFIPTADGPVAVEVRDLYAGGGPRHAFLLRAIPPQPDYDLTVTVDRVTATPGKPATVVVKVNRRAGFNKAVEVVAEGLPEGVKVEVAQPAKPDPNTVTLSLSAEKPVSGAFRVAGAVKDESKLRRVARFAMPEFDHTTNDLWLTVTRP
jgi:hypothetical protein